MPTSEETRVAQQEANIAQGHTHENAYDFDFDAPPLDEPDSGMGRFAPLEEDPEAEAVGVDNAIEGEGGSETPGEAGAGESPTVSPAMEELRARAEEVGIDPATLNGMKSSQVVAILDNFDAYLDSIAVPEITETTPTKAVVAATETVAPAASEHLKFDDLFEEDADPGMVKAFGRLAEFINKAQGSQSKMIADIQSTADVQAAAVSATRVEASFDALTQRHGVTATKLFGSEGKVRPAQKVNRQNVQKALSILVQGHKATGTEMPKESVLFDTALKTALGERYSTLVSGKKEAAVRNRQGQFLQRPQSRAPGKSKLSGAKLAVRNVAALMQERGLTDVAVAVTEEDEFTA